MIEFHLNARSGVAPYMQLIQQVRQAIRLGTIGEGDRLPTVKEVVARLAINPNTVLKAYRELEREGLVEARRGLGTFVRRSQGAPPADSSTSAARALSRRPREWSRSRSMPRMARNAAATARVRNQGF